MSKFARAATTKVRTRSDTPDAVTHEGGGGFSRDAKSELFLLGVTNMVNENTFYESGSTRDARFETLAKQVIAEDPAWVGSFIPYLRDELHMRSASVVLACLFAKERLGQTASEGTPSIRSVVSSAIRRADEPSELLAFWMSRWGRRIPKPVKRGLADAIQFRYNERNALKWDSDRSTVRMGDVIELVHPEPVAPWQSDLFRYLIDDRHGRAWTPTETSNGIYEHLKMIAARRDLEALPVAKRRKRLGMKRFVKDREAAGITWEWLGGWLQGPMDKEAWESVIPEMGYMALLRNLRNFEQAKVSVAVKQDVIAKLTDPDEVAKSRQLPIRFYSAYKAAGKEWDEALERALNLTLKNIPRLEGNTLVMVDASGSMTGPLSGRSQAARWELATLFGAALTLRNSGKLYAYHNEKIEVAVRSRESVLQAIAAVGQFVGGGTWTWKNTKEAFDAGSFDRIVIVTDEQAHDREVGLPKEVPIYTFNVAGYRYGHAPSFNESKRYTFGGLTDAGFAAIAALEAGLEGIAKVA